MKCGDAVYGRFRTCEQCGRRTLVVTHEHFDAIDGVIVGGQRCTVCRARHLYARRLTRADLRGRSRRHV
jgi:hypothetical protein